MPLFDKKEERLLQKLRTPEKIQDFLNTIPINFEVGGETCRSPRGVLRERRAHCLEGAMLAAAMLQFHGEPPLLFDLKTTDDDHDHVAALFRRHGRWGAISKTNHAVLRYRDPIYRTLRELALSYFHEYFLQDGRKTLRSYSARPFDLRRFDHRLWQVAEDDLWYINDAIDDARHVAIAPRSVRLRRADTIEKKAGELEEWGREGKIKI